MKIEIPQAFVPFGPVGHPQARPIMHLLGFSKEDVEGDLYRYLNRVCSQPDAPGMFYEERESFEEQGYFVVPVVNSEISDALLATLKPCALYVPAAAGAPGRKLEDVWRYLPNYLKQQDLEVWDEGNAPAGCDHDIGLESYDAVCKDNDTGEVVPEEQWHENTTYFSTFRCTRCNALHAYRQPD